MDKLLLIDKEGNLYNLEPPDETLKLIENNNFNRLNRVSNSDWCFWCINSDFECQLYVYRPFNYIEIVEETYENQRRFKFSVRPNFSSLNLLENDPPIFSSKSGSANPHDRAFQNQGWYYAYDFKMAEKKSLYQLRNIFKFKIDLPLTCEFANDISVGGWALSKFNPGKNLSVWIVCNSGRLFFRENVSYSNPEGSKWLEISLPNSVRVLSLSCTQDGYLWVITCEGDVLLRNDITEEEPYGKTWMMVSTMKPAPFVQITCSYRDVYALDSKGCVYKRNNTELNIIGNEWIKILKDLSNISVSRSNKLWALSKDKLYLFIGFKLDMSSKIEWKTVILPFEFDSINANTCCDYFDDLTKIKF
ncbi:unnamed protein product [Brachionus calyciflorus]|uniref:Uncharacterized protein n=1 Tax=Brachionus calyciflorus TaxID=104777 RepID=A0A814PUP1_9BILA|nr:unnamed protein product [Brachionus calyciflorus]